MRTWTISVAALVIAASPAPAQRYSDAEGHLRIALAKQPFSPTGTSPGPTTMANGGIQQALAQLGAVIRIDEAALTPDEATEYGAWKRLGMALGHFADIVAKNERDGYFTVGGSPRVRRCPAWSRGSSTRGRPASRSRSACCGSTRIPTSTHPRPRAAARSAACRWRSRPAARSSGC